MQDTTFEMEKRRNRPEKYNRELVHKTVKAMERISEARLLTAVLLAHPAVLNLDMHCGSLNRHTYGRPVPPWDLAWHMLQLTAAFVMGLIQAFVFMLVSA